MSEPRNIAVVTVDWSDDYTGGELSGRWGQEGHEKYIFRPYRKQYYGYFPPNGGNFPVTQSGDDWLIFFVSRPTKADPSVVVGWYENASIIGGNRPRPDADNLEDSHDIGPFSYSARAPYAVSIPAAARDCLLPKGDSLRSFSYVRENGVDKKSRMELVKPLLKYRERVSDGASDDGVDPGAAAPIDPVLKRKVERAAISAVKADFGKAYRFKDRQQQRGFGYDLEFADRSTGEIWCVEVKGTAGGRDAFYITRSERNADVRIKAEDGENSLRRWQLALVTNALDPKRRRIQYFDAAQMESSFEFQCLQWQAVPKDKDPA
ncbi:protein NO VEIN domain-containing protein [Aurantiacibacter spongiae]|uniref:DUF3883 domain-containing protein n=1 Tax=Aurantiacibacter spongiae TaxID=2488860 RepID=A0A3N5CV69_9SPHN|nr:DUF3883 domain-containing protein [Aurantiacibacter spongiae]RPF70519.1 DUF3883 domain-containing protein [Aurantiacibacter spongiae]